MIQRLCVELSVDEWRQSGSFRSRRWFRWINARTARPGSAIFGCPTSCS